MPDSLQPIRAHSLQPLLRAFKLTSLLIALATGAAPPLSATRVPVAAPGGHPGDALRSRLGIVLPASETMIIVYGVARHHTSTEWSVIAWRSKDGKWTVDRAGEEGSGLLKIDPHPLPASSTVLPADQGGTLDRLLKDRQTYREKPGGGEPAIGGYASEMEIVTPRRTRRIEWAGKLIGTLGRIADIVLGSR